MQINQLIIVTIWIIGFIGLAIFITGNIGMFTSETIRDANISIYLILIGFFVLVSSYFLMLFDIGINPNMG